MFQKITGIIILRGFFTLLLLAIVGCSDRQDILINLQAKDINFSAADLGVAWNLLEDSDLYQVSESEIQTETGADNWSVRAFQGREGQSLMSMIFVYPSVAAAKDGVTSEFVQKTKETPKVVAETFNKITAGLEDDDRQPEAVILQEEKVSGIGDEAVAAWVEGNSGATFIFRKANVVAVITGSEAKEVVTGYAHVLVSKIDSQVEADALITTSAGGANWFLIVGVILLLLAAFGGGFYFGRQQQGKPSVPPLTSIVCTNCGAEMPPQAKFCIKCGRSQ